MISPTFWKNKRVFITGHTGFKGSWLCLWLHKLGAQITGYALEPPTNPSLFELAQNSSLITSIHGDVRDRKWLTEAISKAAPEIVFHLAAQPLVRDSYKLPVETYETNVMGTVNLLEAVRSAVPSVRAIVNVTTDKVYENPERNLPFKENEPLGGYDPYSNSKACSELVAAAYRNSFFNPADYDRHHCGVATARAGNVIGGGDWATDRIVPDCIRAFARNEPVILRNPHATRPWQHVLEPLSGYMTLAEKLFLDGKNYAEAWNFGPTDNDCVAVAALVQKFCAAWGKGSAYKAAHDGGPHEAAFLKLDISKSSSRLVWRPRWKIDTAVSETAAWYRNVNDGRNAREECLRQIEEYEAAADSNPLRHTVL
jgi:CDP-glucose 4,6-dehydratase